MTFGYALLGALVLLLPGFAFYYGFRLGEAGSVVGPRPDQPNSNQTIFIVVFFALAAHIVGVSLFAVNDVMAWWHPIITMPIDPSPYRAFWSGRVPTGMTNLALEWEMTYLLSLTAVAWMAGDFIAKRVGVSSTLSPLRFGWLLPIVKLVEARTHIVIGYVLTTVGYEGEWIAYEGIVRRLSLDDDDAITMIVLEQCDRFVMRISNGKLERVDSDGDTIALIHIRSDQVANYALELLEVVSE